LFQREFKLNFESYGGVVKAEIQYRYRQEDYSEAVRQIKGWAPDVFFVPGYDESGLILKEASKAGINAVPLGADGWGEKGFFRKSGNIVKEGYYCTHWSPEVETDVSRKFVGMHQRGEAISPAEALAYDAVFLVADAVRRAKSTNREKIREALSQTENFQGVTGIITFNALGDPIKDAVIMKINGSKASYLKRIPAQ